MKSFRTNRPQSAPIRLQSRKKSSRLSRLGSAPRSAPARLETSKKSRRRKSSIERSAATKINKKAKKYLQNVSVTVVSMSGDVILQGRYKSLSLVKKYIDGFDKNYDRLVYAESPETYVKEIINNDRNIFMLIKGNVTEGLDEYLDALANINEPREVVEYVRNAPDNIKDNLQFMLRAVSKAYRTLEFASDRLRDEEELVNKAIKKNGYAYSFASNRIKRNKKYALRAIAQASTLWSDLSEELQHDPQIIKKYVISSKGRVHPNLDFDQFDSNLKNEVIRLRIEKMIEFYINLKSISTGLSEGPIPTVHKANHYHRAFVNPRIPKNAISNSTEDSYILEATRFLTLVEDSNVDLNRLLRKDDQALEEVINFAIQPQNKIYTIGYWDRYKLPSKEFLRSIDWRHQGAERQVPN